MCVRVLSLHILCGGPLEQRCRPVLGTSPPFMFPVALCGTLSLLLLILLMSWPRLVFLFARQHLHCCCCWVAQSCLTLCDPMNCSTPGFPVLHSSQNLLRLRATESVMTSNHLIPCSPLLLPSIFPSIRVFSSESALHIRWPKYWSFSISPFNEYSRLISFRIDWFDLAVQGILESLLQHHNLKAFFSAQSSLWSNSHIHM